MTCPACGAEPPAGSAFCNGCGARLELTCPSCGATPPPGSGFCNGCGAKLDSGAAAPVAPERDPRDYTPKHLADRILQSKSALEGERKQVTVLFADVKGSMELAEQLDPEVWHRILERFFEILAEGVHRFEGTVNQYTGDGIMALFGAPIAHEDHPQRACYAALHLREEIARYGTEVKREHGLGFSTRMGLHSGEVVVGKIGDDLRMDYTAQGHTVGLAQRMESLASPDTCYLTGVTAELVRGYFELENLGEFAVKGVGGPVEVHRLAGVGRARTRFDVSRARGLTRFVGRDADMGTLESALAQAREGNGQVVGVVAEAGTGKSRLCFEFVERLRAEGVRVYEGHAVAHGKNIPNLPMLQVFRAYHGIEEGDDDRRAREKIAGSLLLLDESFRDVLPILFEFFGVPDPDRPVPRMDPEAKQRQILGVLRRIVQESSTRDFAVLIEDLHWLDPSSENFLEHWVDAVAGSSFLLLVNFRPEYRADWMQKSYYRQLPLAPLGPKAIRELLADLLGDHPSTAGLADTIHERTGGNPFYSEELVQALIESGHLEGSRGSYRLDTPIERLEVPASVQAVLAARIDRLPEREKHVLQAAAVIGVEFAEPLLLAAAEIPEGELREALAALKTAEFVYEQALYPVAEYAFKHPLTQEVALGSQLRERRRRTHAAVARGIEAKSDGDRDGDEHAALLAHHWAEAGEPLTAARWYHRAADWVGRSNTAEAMRHWRQVLALTDPLEASDERDELRLAACGNVIRQGGWRFGLSREELDELFAEGKRLAARAERVDEALALYTGYGVAVGLAGELRRFHEVAREARAQVDDSTSLGARAWTLVDMSFSSLMLGQVHEALRFAEEVSRLVEGDMDVGFDFGGFSVMIWSYFERGYMSALLGRLDEGRALLQQAFDRGRPEDAEVLAAPYSWSGEIADWLGEGKGSPLLAEARRHVVHSIETSERAGNHFLRSWGYRGLAWTQILNEDWSDALETLEEALALAHERRVGLEHEAQLLALQSRAWLGAGDTARARAKAEESVAVAREQGALFLECQAQVTLARALRADPGARAGDEIEACLARALELVSESGGRVLEPQIAEERGRLAELRGDRAAATAELERARDLYAEIGATGHAQRLEQELAP